MYISDAIAGVRARIGEACQRAAFLEEPHPQRKEEDVTLIAVSKTKPIPMLQEAYDAGQRDFGENKVQEILEKYDHLPKDVRWHLIGHLQTNKVKYIADKVAMIHSLDSLHLARVIEKECARINRIMPVLVQVNVSGEESKFGVAPKDAEPLIRDLSGFPHIQVEGLMTVAPFVEFPEENRVIFSKLYQLFLDIKEKNIDNINMNVLSMGMSGDFEVAVEEGATMVRVGTSIFGARNYQIKEIET